MRTYTIAQLITRIRAVADINGTDVFVTDAELQVQMDEGYSELVDILARASIHQFETSYSFTTTGATDTYAIPSDHYKSLAVDYKYATDRYVKVDPLMFEERNNFMLGINGSARGWRLVGENIVLYPKPPSGQVYRLIYIPAPANISTSSTSTTIDGIAGWEEYIVQYVVRFVKTKQEDDAGVAKAQAHLDRLADRINEMDQDRQPPQRITDVNEGPWDWDPNFFWGRGW